MNDNWDGRSKSNQRRRPVRSRINELSLSTVKQHTTARDNGSERILARVGVVTA